MELEKNIWENLINRVTDAIFLLDCKGNILYFNHAVVQMMGYTVEETLKMNTYDLVDTGQMDVHILLKVIQTKRTVTTCQKYVKKDGTETPYMLVTQSPILDSSGNVKYSVGIIHNMNQLNEAYENAVRVSPRRLLDISDKKKNNQFIYKSQEMQRLVDAVNQVADSDATILILGESGTGKEVLADYIHQSSSRREKELVTINCAALPENLLEAELFGYEKGAFTGAIGQGKPGLVEAADGGTLFLDEIDSMPYALQGKLLRLLETKEVRRLGSVKSKRVNFRLLAATNADLRQCIAAKSFRMDLYYRLSVLPFTIPPLRHRCEDIRPLCDFFLDYYERKYGRRKKLSLTVYEKFEAYHWPGNVRELKNVIERLVLITDVSVQEIMDITDEVLEGETFRLASHTLQERTYFQESYQPPYDDSKSLKENMEDYEYWIISKSLEKNGSLSKAAAELGSSKSTLGRKVQIYNKQLSSQN